MTRAELQARSKKELAALARENDVAGWRQMRKEQLVDALAAKFAPPPPTSSGRKKTKTSTGAEPAKKLHAPVQPAAARNTSGDDSPEQHIESSKFDVGTPTRDLSARVPKDLPKGYGKDRIVALVRDPYWLYCYWELTPHAIARAEAALGVDWYGAKPILRVLDVTSSDRGTTETVLRDIEIHGGCNNWYIDVNNPPRSFRIDIGYLSRQGKFYVLARSNVVTTPRAGVSDTIDENWADLDARKADRIYAMSSGYDPTASSLEVKQFLDERLRHPIGSPAVSSLGSGGLILPGGKTRQFWFQLDAELIVFGATDPNARVTLQGQPVTLRSDGTFTIRFKLPDSRQIIPAVATSPDGSEERTIVLAVERNTRQLDPVVHEEKE